MAALRAARFAAAQINANQMKASSPLQLRNVLVAVQTVSSSVSYKLLLEMAVADGTDGGANHSTIRCTCWVEVMDREWNKKDRYALKNYSHLQQDGADLEHSAPKMPDVKFVVAEACRQIMAKPECLVAHGLQTEERRLCDTVVQCLKTAPESTSTHLKPLWAKKRAAGGTVFELLLQLENFSGAGSGSGAGKALLSRGKKGKADIPLIKCQMFLPASQNFEMLRLLTADIVEDCVEVRMALDCFDNAIEKSSIGSFRSMAAPIGNMAAGFDNSSSTSVDERVHSLQNQLDRLRTEHSAVSVVTESTKKKLAAEVIARRQDADTSRRLLADQERQLGAKDGQIEQMAAQLHTLKTKLRSSPRSKKGSGADAGLVEGGREKDALAETVERLKGEEKQLKAQCVAAIQQRDVLHKKTKSLVAHAEELDDEVEQLTETKKKTEKQLEELKLQLKQAESQGNNGADRGQGDAESIEGMLSQKVEGLREEEKQLKAQCVAAIKQRDVLHKKTKGLVAHVEELDDEVEELAETKKKLEAETKALELLKVQLGAGNKEGGEPKPRTRKDNADMAACALQWAEQLEGGANEASVGDVGDLLKTAGLNEKYVTTFAAKKVGGSAFLALSTSDFKDLGVDDGEEINMLVSILEGLRGVVTGCGEGGVASLQERSKPKVTETQQPDESNDDDFELFDDEDSGEIKDEVGGDPGEIKDDAEGDPEEHGVRLCYVFWVGGWVGGWVGIHSPFAA